MGLRVGLPKKISDIVLSPTLDLCWSISLIPRSVQLHEGKAEGLERLLIEFYWHNIFDTLHMAV